MKIVLYDAIYETPGKDGLSDLVWNVARLLLAQGDAVHIVADYPAGTTPPAGVVYHHCPSVVPQRKNVFERTGTMYRALRYIAQHLADADVIHAPEYHTTAIFSTAQQRIPVVLTTPGIVYERIVNGNPFPIAETQIYKVAASLSAKNCAHIVAISNDQKAWWVRCGADPAHVTVLPYGIQTTYFAPVPDARTRLGWGEAPHILYAGRLSHEKGVDVLLRAFVTVHTRYPAAHLVIVGEGNRTAELRQLATDLGIADAVQWHGWQPMESLAAWYSAADVLVVPSRSEPLGRVVMEAMACATPVVGSRVGGIPDMVRPGDTGWLVPVEDTAALADALTAVLDDPARARARGQRGWQRVQAELRMEQIVRRIREQVYPQAIARQAARVVQGAAR